MQHLACDRRLHASKLLVPLSIPQLVHSDIQNHTKLQAAPEQSYSEVVYRHHLRGLVLYHTAAELRQGLHRYPEKRFSMYVCYIILSIWAHMLSSFYKLENKDNLRNQS